MADAVFVRPANRLPATLGAEVAVDFCTIPGEDLLAGMPGLEMGKQRGGMLPRHVGSALSGHNRVSSESHGRAAASHMGVALANVRVCKI
jgi:hypothetical protein